MLPEFTIIKLNYKCLRNDSPILADSKNMIFMGVSQILGRDKWKNKAKMGKCLISPGLRSNLSSLSLKHTINPPPPPPPPFHLSDSKCSIKFENRTKPLKIYAVEQIPFIPSNFHFFLPKILGKILKFYYTPLSGHD